MVLTVFRVLLTPRIPGPKPTMPTVPLLWGVKTESRGPQPRALRARALQGEKRESGEATFRV